MTKAFEGFPKGGAAFFTELGKKQDRDWFKANKERYEALWQHPMELLLADVAAKLARTFPDAQEPKVMRIYRDTRFAKDKSPYKTNIGATLKLGDGPGAPALYVHGDAKEHFVGIGLWTMEPPQVAAYREAVAGNDGVAFARDVKKLVAKGYDVHVRDALKRVPAPYDADHPRGDLLKLKGFAMGFPDVPSGLPAKAAYVAWIAEKAKATANVVDWLTSAIA